MKPTILMIVLFASINSFAQDADFSQSFSNPLFLNPAYSGSLGYSRLAGNFKMQSFALYGDYSTTTGIAYDQYVPGLHGGLGLRYLNMVNGNAIFNNNADISYTYNFNINDNFQIRPAINIGIGHTRIDWDRIFFPPPHWPYPTVTKRDPLSYFNIGAGLLIRYKNFMIGSSYDHINKPETLYVYSNSELISKLMIHADYQINFSEKTFLTPGIIYSKQQDFEAINYLLMLKTGFFKLGTRFKQNFVNADCLTIMLGFCNKNISIGYSYDIMVSKLTSATAGAHEISAAFKINNKNDKEKYKVSQFVGF